MCTSIADISDCMFMLAIKDQGGQEADQCFMYLFVHLFSLFKGRFCKKGTYREIFHLHIHFLNICNSQGSGETRSSDRDPGTSLVGGDRW